MIADATTSKEAWDTLKSTFQQTGTIGIITLRRKMYTLMLPEGGDIEDHLRSMRECRAELCSLGDKVEDRDFSLALLTSLPATWDSFIRSIDLDELTSTSTAAAKITPAKLIARITMEANHTIVRDGEPDNALAASDSTCYRCGKRGHFARQCRSSRRDNGQSRGDFSCAHVHFNQGPHPGPGRANMAEDEDSGSDADNNVGYIVWMAHDNDTNLPGLLDEDSDSDNEGEPGMAFRATAGVWYFDSGVTIHIACDRHNFTDYRPTPGATIRGIGSTPIPKAGEGTVKLTTFVGNKCTVITLQKVVHIPGASANLVSIKRITGTGATVDFGRKRVTI